MPDYLLNEGECVAVPTGGAVPRGTDGVVIVEYTEDYGDGTIGVAKPAAPGMNLIFRGDDVYPGKVILHKGRSLSSADIGALGCHWPGAGAGGEKSDRGRHFYR